MPTLSGVNGARLSPGDLTPLDDGAVLRIGRSLFVVRQEFDGAFEPEAPLNGLEGPFGLRSVARFVTSLARGRPNTVLVEGETGVGKVVKGEGIMSLSRSLLHAGASNIILSLWKVGDLDSKLLMIEFYKAYLSGKCYADALRTAKLSVLKLNPNPKSWAGFVLFGI